MSAVPSLLPPVSTSLERAIEQTQARYWPPARVPGLWSADDCPEDFLPYLAAALSVDEWSHGWPVEKKRAVVREAIYIHEHRATPAAIRRALAALGHPDADLVERADYVKRNGTARRDGRHRRFGQAGWATYRVILHRPVTIDQAQQIKRLLLAVGRNCVHLVALDFSRATLRRNGVARRNGQYTRGVVIDQLT